MWKRALIVLLIVLCVLAAGVFMWGSQLAGTGTYIAADSPIILFENGTGEPVVMLGRKEGMFAGLRTGDRILILHDGAMMLSYPARMNVYFCIRLKKGDVSDVPEETRKTLEEMGWLEEKTFGQNQ